MISQVTTMRAALNRVELVGPDPLAGIGLDIFTGYQNLVTGKVTAFRAYRLANNGQLSADEKEFNEGVDGLHRSFEAEAKDFRYKVAARKAPKEKEAASEGQSEAE
jgi:hypothetical protein